MSIDYSSIKQQKVKKADEVVVKENFFTRLINKIEQFQTVPSKEKQFFVQNLRVMVTGGLPLDRALRTLGDQTENVRFKKIINQLLADTVKGVSFADSLSRYKSVFGNLFINMVQAGEMSGRLDEVLKQIYLQLKKSNELKSNVKSAMTYPVIVVLAMIGIGIGMLVFVIPKITGIFTEANVSLPLPTRILIATSNFIVSHGILVSILAIVLVGSFIAFIKTQKGKYILHAILLKTPIFASIIKQINLAQFTRNLSSLIKTDIPIVKTFEVTSQIDARAHRTVAGALRRQMHRGRSLEHPIHIVPQFMAIVDQRGMMPGAKRMQFFMVDQCLGLGSGERHSIQAPTAVNHPQFEKHAGRRVLAGLRVALLKMEETLLRPSAWIRPEDHFPCEGLRARERMNVDLQRIADAIKQHGFAD